MAPKTNNFEFDTATKQTAAFISRKKEITEKAVAPATAPFEDIETIEIATKSDDVKVIDTIPDDSSSKGLKKSVEEKATIPALRKKNFYVYVTNEEDAKIRAATSATGKKLNDFIVDALIEYIDQTAAPAFDEIQNQMYELNKKIILEKTLGAKPKKEK
jgi:ribosomal protein S21